MTRSTVVSTGTDSQDQEVVRAWVGKMRGRLLRWSSLQRVRFDSRSSRQPARPWLRLGPIDPDLVERLLRAGAPIGLLPDGGATGTAGEYERPALPTLHSREELRGLLQELAWRTTVLGEEMGVHTLSLVFGLLEWQGAHRGLEGEERFLAPVWLQPVRLLPDDPRGESWRLVREGPIEINPTVRQVLRERDGVDLPEWTAGRSMATALEQMGGDLAGAATRGGWKIHPQWVLTHLSLHWQSMWADLDPGHWPQDALLRHPMVRNFALGRPIEQIAPDPAGGQGEGGVAGGSALAGPSGEGFDELELQGQLPRLIALADSTQHAALLEALRGRSLVIEAAPGTGRSRTIANLAAAALGAGKTVLLVATTAEALAAVRRKLTQAGLGDFCLQLGDASGRERGEDRGIVRTQEELSRRIRERLARRGSWHPPADLPALRSRRDGFQRQLTELRRVLAQPCGAAGLTLVELIGERERLAQEGALPFEVSGTIQLPHAARLTLEEVETIGEAADLYGQYLSEMAERSQPGAHPWQGVENQALTLEEERQLRQSLDAITSATLRIESEVDLFRVIHRVAFEATEEQIAHLLTLDGQIPEVPPTVDRTLLPTLLAPGRRATLTRLEARCRDHQQRSRALTPFLGQVPDLEGRQLQQLIDACRQIRRMDVDEKTIGELRAYAGWLRSQADDLDRAARLFHDFAQHFGQSFSFDLATAQVVLRGLLLCARAPIESLTLRALRLEEPGFGASLTRAYHEALELRALAAELGERLDLTLAPPRDEIERHARTCAQLELLGFASRGYRRARHDWRVMTRSPRLATRQRLARDYRQLLHYHDALAHFLENREYLETLGGLFEGMETPFEGLLAVVGWWEEARADLGVGSTAAVQIVAALLRLPAAQLRALQRMGAGEDAVQFQRHLDRLVEALPRLPLALQQESTSDLTYLAQQMRESAFQAQAVLDDLEEAGYGHFAEPIGSLLGSLQDWRGLLELEGAITADLRALGLPGEGPPPATAELLRWRAAADVVSEVTEQSTIPIPLQQWLLAPAIDERRRALRGLIAAIRADFTLYRQAKSRFIELAQLEEGVWFPREGATGSALDLRRVRKRAERALAAWDQLALWLGGRRARQTLLDLGLAPLVASIEAGEISPRHIPTAVRAIYLESLLREAYRQHPVLERFHGIEYEEARRQYVALDQRVEEQTRGEIAWQVDRRPVPAGIAQGPLRSRTELGLLEGLVAADSPGLPIRQVFERAGRALTALMPCVLTSPYLVAPYLPPSLGRFDLVILDEASRLRPEEALGAVVRGEQLVVVGDPLQLPPSSFLTASGEEAGEGESLLDLPAIRDFAPHRLRWHSQSRHESLIAFSNRQWYGDRLVVLPSAKREGSADGAFYRPVREGLYEAEVNPREAAALVEAALHHLLAAPEESLGLVALTERQRDSIEARLAERLAESPTAAARVTAWHDRGLPVFIKTVETIQGEVRDAVLVSLTAGRDSQGRIRPDSFGVLHHPRHGHRYLNVLTTRARRRLLVFGSLLPEEIPAGLEALRDYLVALMAAGDRLAGGGADGPGGSPLAASLARLLQAHGYQVELLPDGGRGLLDLAICARELTPTGSLAPSPRGQRELLGVRLEGIEPALEPGALSTRDRERVAPELLTRLGWPPLYRLWPPDWFRQRTIELRRLQRRLDGLR